MWKSAFRLVLQRKDDSISTYLSQAHTAELSLNTRVSCEVLLAMRENDKLQLFVLNVSTLSALKKQNIKDHMTQQQKEMERNV